MGNEFCIVVENLWKRYGLPIKPTLKRLSRRMRGQDPNSVRDEETWALRDINLQVNPGETVGVIGQNGAGKSTLLKVLAGVTPATCGKTEVYGRVFSMIELNAGLNSELNGRENIYLLGAIMGFTKSDMKRRYDDIADFSELEAWLEKPVWQYSSGMEARLGFAVAMNVDADVLLIDEALAVGDLSFKKKCYGHIERLSNQGTAIVFVSHNIRQIERLCDRVMYLEQGRAKLYGTPQEVCYAFHRDTTAHFLSHSPSQSQPGIIYESTGEIEIRSVSTLDKLEKPQKSFETFDTIVVRIGYDAKERVENPIIGMNLLNSETIKIASFILQPDSENNPLVLQGHGHFDLIIPHISLLAESYFLSLAIKASNGRHIVRAFQMATFDIELSTETSLNAGLMYLDHEWRVPIRLAKESPESGV